MKKQQKTLLAFTTVLVLLLAVWGVSSLLTSEEPAETSEPLPSIDPIFQAEAEDIVRIDIVSENDRFALIPYAVETSRGDMAYDWKVEGMEDYPFDLMALDRLASTARQTYTSREFETDAQDVAQYGLDNPQATYAVTLRDGSQHTIKIGRLLPTGNFYYAMLNDSGRVCALAKSTGDRIMQARKDFLDNRQIVPFRENELTRFIFNRSRDDVRIVTDCVLIDAASGESYLEFHVIEPIVRTGNPEGLQRLLNDFLSISASDFVELDPEDLSIYGLDQPQYTFEMHAGSRSNLITIGSRADSNNFYAVSDSVPAVFKVAVKSFSTIDIQITDMLDKFVQLLSIWDVKQIDADLFGESFVVEIEMGRDQRANDEDVVFLLDGVDARISTPTRRSLFSQFYQRMISVMISDLDVDADPVNTADARMVFHLRADPDRNLPARRQVVEFARRDDYTYYVFIDGTYTGFYINGHEAFHSQRKDYEGILVAVDMMRYAIEHAEDGVFDPREGYQLD